MDMHGRWTKRSGMRIAILGFCLYGLIFAGKVLGAETSVHKLDDVVVSEKSIEPEITQTPQMTTIDVGAYETIGSVQNIGDILKDQPILDFRKARIWFPAISWTVRMPSGCGGLAAAASLPPLTGRTFTNPADARAIMWWIIRYCRPI